MRVGIDARELATPATGVGRYLAELVARWCRADYAQDDDLILFAPGPVRDAERLLGRSVRAHLCVVPGHGGTAWEQALLPRAARRANLNVFFAPGYTAPLAVGVPTVVAMHDVSFAAHPEWFRWREGIRQRFVARQTAHRAARVVTLTEFSRTEIRRWLGVPGDRIEVIPPAVDVHPALAAPDSRSAQPHAALARHTGPFILFVGSIFARRHVPTLLDAFAAVAAVKPEVRLVLVGADRTWPPERIGDRIARSPVAQRITWITRVDETELRGLYHRARVFAFLSEYEGFGLTPLEALAAGVPPVVGDVPVAHEAYGPAARYTDPHDAPAVATALLDVLDAGAIRAGILAEARAVTARYSWNTAAESTYEVLRRAALTLP